MAITEILMLILLIVAVVFTIARIRGVDGLFGASSQISFQTNGAFEQPFATEINEKPIQLFYNSQPIEFKNGVAYNTRTHEVFDEDPLRNVAVQIGRETPYELSVAFPYGAMRVVSGPYGDHTHHPTLFSSEKDLHPGEKFIVKEPGSVVLFYP